MGNMFYLNEYDDIIMNVNSFAPCKTKKFNYVCFKVPHDDDDEIENEKIKYNH
jgi:hypothetical protein